MIHIKRLTPRDWWESLAVIGIMGACQLGLLVVYWLWFQDSPPLVVLNDPLPVVGEQTGYAPGYTIQFEFDFCRRSRGEITRTRRWIDGLMYTEPVLTIAGGERECVETALVATVPKIMARKRIKTYRIQIKILEDHT